MSYRTAPQSRCWILLVLACATVSLTWGQGQSPKILGFKKQFTIEIQNPSPISLENRPIVLSVDEIRAFAPDFNSYNCAIFEEKGGGTQLVLSQADDLNKDRYHDEIVLIRTLPPNSTTQLTCYYSPTGNFQLMTTAKTSARASSGPAPSVSWESNLCAFTFANGQIEPYGKLYPGLILQKTKSAETKPQEWGMALLDPDASAGVGGLSLWDGKTRIPLLNLPGRKPLVIQETILARGPLRSLVRVDYSGIQGAKQEYQAVLLLSAFADSPVARIEVIVGAKADAKTGAPILCGPGVRRLADETLSSDPKKGYLAEWGRGVEGAGEIGLAVVFNPAEYAGLADEGPDRWVELAGTAGKKHTFWILSGWDKGLGAPGNPAGTNWGRRIEAAAEGLLVPVKVGYNAK